MSDQPASETEIFHFSRTVDAPQDLVWACWTQAEHLGQWFGPPGTVVKVKTLDLRPGGITMWGKWIYREVDPTSRLTYVVSFCTEDGEPVRHPMAPLWPLEVLADQTFREEGGKTVCESRSWPINATAEERAVFVAGHASMEMGFGGTFIQLSAYLARLGDAK
jgi:uncharacterized protein YndB with AHSA1/START domain